jgi:5-methylcytosine-specific restriction endonuclease McrA
MKRPKKGVGVIRRPVEPSGLKPHQIVVPLDYDFGGLKLAGEVIQKGELIILPDRFVFGTSAADKRLRKAWESQRVRIKKGAQQAAPTGRKRKRKKVKTNRAEYTRPDGSIDYYAYIASADWKRKRDGVIGRRGGCEVCGTKHELQVHHKHYKTLTRESDGDLKVLCGGCHANHHEGDKGIVMDPMTTAYVGMFRDQ